MTKILDTRKQSDWQKRLKKFRSRGQTVDRFCQLEKVPPSSFYYWSRHFRQAAQELSSASPKRRHPDRDAVHLPVAKDSDPSTGSAESTAPMVHFAWNSNLQVSIPAHCLAAIRSVLEWTHQRVEESPNESASTFEQVLASSR
jgi:hypothetical protein